MARTPIDMTRKLLLLALTGVLAGGSLLTCFAGGDEVVVIYNSALAESEALANYYARQRNVPRSQVFGFKLTTAEAMSRGDFRDELQRPLAKKLESLKLWRIGSGEMPGTNGKPVLAFSFTTSIVDNGIFSNVIQQGFDRFWLHKLGGIGQRGFVFRRRGLSGCQTQQRGFQAAG